MKQVYNGKVAFSVKGNNEVMVFEDTYTIDPERFYSTDIVEIGHYIKNDLYGVISYGHEVNVHYYEIEKINA